MAPIRGLEPDDPIKALGFYSDVENHFGIQGLRSQEIGIDLESFTNKAFAMVNLLNSTGVVATNYPFALGAILHLTQNEEGSTNNFGVDPEDQSFQLNSASEFVLQCSVQSFLDTVQDFPSENQAIENRLELLRQTLYAIGIEDSARRFDAHVNQLMLESASTLLEAQQYCDENETEIKEIKSKIAGRTEYYKSDPLNSIPDNNLMALAFNLRDLNEGVQEVANVNGGDSNVLRSDLVELMQGTEFPDNPTPERISSIMHYRMPAVDYVTMIKIIHENDLEGLAINTAQYIVELQNAPINADSWRKAQTILSFYAPLLELVGLDALAKEAYSSAYVFLYSGENPYDKEIVQKAINIYENANRVFENSRLYSSIIDNLARARLDISTDQITTRVKSLGSIMDKLEREKIKGRGVETISDPIGIRIVIPKPKEEGNYIKHTKRYITAVLESLISSGCKIEDPRGDSAIEWRFNHKDADKKTMKIQIGSQTYEIDLLQKSKTGYAGVHIVVEGDGASYEIQIVNESESNVNKTIASHAFYKARASFSKLGALMKIRDGESNSIMRKLRTQQINKIIYKILSLASEQNGRFEKLKTGEMFYLNPKTQEKMFNVLFDCVARMGGSWNNFYFQYIIDQLVLQGDWDYGQSSKTEWEENIYNS